MSITVNDLVEFRTGFRSRWLTGYVEEITAHGYRIRAGTRLHTIRLGGPGRGGKVRELTGARCVAAVLDTPATSLRLVQGGASELRAVPRPRSGVRGVGQKADDYSCVPLCRGCHERVTDSYTLPGWSREETTLVILRAQVALLTEWAACADREVADHITSITGVCREP